MGAACLPCRWYLFLNKKDTNTNTNQSTNTETNTSTNTCERNCSMSIICTNGAEIFQNKELWIQKHNMQMQMPIHMNTNTMFRYPLSSNEHPAHQDMITSYIMLQPTFKRLFLQNFLSPRHARYTHFWQAGSNGKNLVSNEWWLVLGGCDQSWI